MEELKPKPPRANPPKPSRDEQITRLVRSYIGPRWDTHYAKAWRKLGSGAGVNIGVSWNWAAALLTVPWLAYRKHARMALALVVLAVILNAFVGGIITRLTGSPFAILGLWPIIAVVVGCFGDMMILQRAYAVVAEVHNEAGASQQVASGVITAGGVSPGRVVGLFLLTPLAAAAIYFLAVLPYQAAPRKNEEAAMRRYLDQLQTMEEQYRVDSGRYLSDPAAFAAIADSVDQLFSPVIEATDSTFHATVTAAPPLVVRCSVASGTINPISNDSASTIVCR
jgi:hypothetical protein